MSLSAKQAELSRRIVALRNLPNPKALNRALEQQARLDDLMESRRRSRAKLAKELRGSRDKLRELNATIQQKRCELVTIETTLAHLRETRAIPNPMATVSQRADGLPSKPGIYFVWRDGQIIYVGQALNLSRRCRFGHHVMRQNDSISWIEFDLSELVYAECFYIGLLRPVFNRGTPCY